MMELTLFQPGGLIALMQVLMIDVVLAGDNAVVIGLAAARVPPALRKKVILWGLVAAVVLRVGLAVVAVSLMQIIGLTLAGGIILLWVCWRFWRDISGHAGHGAPEVDTNTSLKRAVMQIVLADVSMSLDNVVCGADGCGRKSDCPASGALSLDQLCRTSDRALCRARHGLAWLGRSRESCQLTFSSNAVASSLFLKRGNLSPPVSPASMVRSSSPNAFRPFFIAARIRLSAP
jgi:YjbE family integral membrane protein